MFGFPLVPAHHNFHPCLKCFSFTVNYSQLQTQQTYTFNALYSDLEINLSDTSLRDTSMSRFGSFILFDFDLSSKPAMATPWIYSSGTGPNSLESIETCSLSPSSQQCPAGTVTSLVDLERGVRIRSPGSPTTRLHTCHSSGFSGSREETISPWRASRPELRKMIVRSPILLIVGDIDSPSTRVNEILGLSRFE